MRHCMVVVLAFGFLTAATANDQDAAVKDELKKLEGTWVRIYVEADGKKSEDGKKEPDKAIRLVIGGDKFGKDTFKLDPSKKPKHIDLAQIDDKGKAMTLPGIYELKGDVLKVCFPFPFGMKFDKLGKRPSEFGSKPGGDDVLEVYQRVNPQDAAKTEIAKLQGTWKVVAMEAEGQKVPEEFLKKKEMQLLVKQDRLSFSGPDDLQPFRVDPTAKPKTIDFLGDASKVINKGIYELEADTLKLCFSQRPTLDRPKDFDTKGTKYFLFTLKREKP